MGMGTGNAVSLDVLPGKLHTHNFECLVSDARDVRYNLIGGNLAVRLEEFLGLRVKIYQVLDVPRQDLRVIHPRLVLQMLFNDVHCHIDLRAAVDNEAAISSQRLSLLVI